MSTLFFQNRRLLMLAIGLILVAGLSSVMVMPRMEDPVLRGRAGNINTVYPGADAERVESLVTEKIEEELLEVEEIRDIRSVSRVGVSTILIELHDEVYDVDPVWSRVRDRLDDATTKLPDGALDPEFEQLEIKAYAAIVSLSWNREGEANYAILRRLAEDLEDRLRAIPGTEEVDTFGDPSEEITVTFDASELTARGLTAVDVARTIEASDAKISAGRLRSNRYDMVVEIDEQLDSVARIGQIPIQRDSQGRFTRLADVAEISRGIGNPPDSISLIDGNPAIALGLLVRSDHRIDLWSDVVHREVDAFSVDLPPGVHAEIVFDQNNYVEDRLNNLFISLCLGGTGVVLVIFFMMGWRSALIVGSALPLTSFMVLAGLRFLGIPIHQMSVTGLIIALGLLIDNAIVIVDEVITQIREGKSAVESVSKSVKHLAIPLFGSTLTTAFAFAPIALMPGPAGEFVGSIAISVILAIFSSFLLAMTITPALAAIAERKAKQCQAQDRPSDASDARPSRGFHVDGIRNAWISSVYRRSLDTVLARPWLGLIIGAAFPVLGFIQARTLPEQFFPPADRNQIQIELELPPHASIAETREQALAIRDLLHEEERVERVHWFLGESTPPFYYNLIPRRANTPRYGQALVQLDSAEDLRPFIHKLQARLDRKIPGARILVRQLEQGPPFDAPIEVRLFGPDLARLQEIGDELHQVVTSTPDVIHTRSEILERSPKLALSVNEEEARMANLDHAAIATQLDASLEGAVGGSIIESTEEIPVRVRVADETRSDLAMIESLDFLGRDASMGRMESTQYAGVPFSALADVTVQSDVAAIQHMNGRRMNEIQAFIPAGVLPSEVLASFENRLQESGVELPDGYEIDYGGEAKQRNNAIGNLMANVGILVVLMVATLVLSFRSFRMASLILTVAALAVGLGLGALWLFGFPFGFMAIVGTMGLIGIAINDSIVVLAAIRADEAARIGDRLAVRRVVQRATRHVLSTSLTTIAGFTPLVLAGGGFWPPLAISIAGGVLGATILALYFVPSAYLILMCRGCPVIEDMVGQPGGEPRSARAAAAIATS